MTQQEKERLSNAINIIKSGCIKDGLEILESMKNVEPKIR